ncbi:hypothetical protein AAE478_008505 [Parahypoxylon ruwenzoriense]
MSPPRNAEALISCHCGAAKQVVALLTPTSDLACDIDLCHCQSCRHSSGLLCVSYARLRQAPQSLSGLAVYPSNTAGQPTEETKEAGLQRYFCSLCGCHVLRYRARRSIATSPTGAVTFSEEEMWEVATGVIIGRAKVGRDVFEADDEFTDENPLLQYARHVNTASTRDGGLFPFISFVEGARNLSTAPLAPMALPEVAHGDDHEDRPAAVTPGNGGGNDGANGEDVLEAHCHCKTVQFRITRPNASSRLPQSNFPDLVYPYCSTPREVYTNPRNEKWWLRSPPGGNPEAEPTRYIAGTCACRSCRVASGFEIQTWAFVPRSNIFFYVSPPSSTTGTAPATMPLDFNTLPPGILQSYESSPGVRREFCPRCGATVFWRDRWRPDIVDVSVGLLDAREGARAESWLDWWTERVSFAEDAGNGRVGSVARWAEGLVENLEGGLRRWGEERRLE